MSFERQSGDILDAVYVGLSHSLTSSPEFAFGWNLLSELWAQDCPVRHTQAESLDELASAALHDLEIGVLKENARVLLLVHAHLVLRQKSLRAMHAAIAGGEPAAASWDPVSHHPSCRPDYLTLGGLDRYQSKLEGLPRGASITALNQCSSAWQEPLAVLIQIDRVADFLGRWRGVYRPSGAFVHPFGDYREGKRCEMIELVPRTVTRVLDVGGGNGGFLKALKEEFHSEGKVIQTHLLELDAASCRQAESKVDRVWHGDFLAQSIDLSFDCICFLDVLEHLENPQTWLEHARSLLADRGCIVMSIPNTGHWSVIADLLEGRWDYAPVGIHCITHLRFFTRRGIEDLTKRASLRISQMMPTLVPMPSWMNPLTSISDLDIDRSSLDTYAWLLRAEPH